MLDKLVKLSSLDVWAFCSLSIQTLKFQNELRLYTARARLFGPEFDSRHLHQTNVLPARRGGFGVAVCLDGKFDHE